MLDAPRTTPTSTFPATRRTTVDGNPIYSTGADAQRAHHAYVDFDQIGKVPAWTIPLNATRWLPTGRRIVTDLP
jgi:hypothetical protein